MGRERGCQSTQLGTPSFQGHTLGNVIFRAVACLAESDMAFAMSLPRTKRVKYIEPDGKEVYQEEDRWTLVRAVHNQEVCVSLNSQAAPNSVDTI